jgi:hypothetical protein
MKPLSYDVPSKALADASLYSEDYYDSFVRKIFEEHP